MKQLKKNLLKIIANNSNESCQQSIDKNWYWNIIMLLYKSFVQPHLEYCMQILVVLQEIYAYNGTRENSKEEIKMNMERFLIFGIFSLKSTREWMVWNEWCMKCMKIMNGIMWKKKKPKLWMVWIKRTRRGHFPLLKILKPEIIQLNWTLEELAQSKIFFFHISHNSALEFTTTRFGAVSHLDWLQRRVGPIHGNHDYWLLSWRPSAGLPWTVGCPLWEQSVG